MGGNLIWNFNMADKRFKKVKFEDRMESREHRSANKRKSRNTRHKAKNMLHDFTGSSVDEDQYYDIMDDLENPNWSDS